LAKDYIILEVWTNGSIHPRHAIHKAAKALINCFYHSRDENTGLNLDGQVQLNSPRQNNNSTSNSTSKKNQ
jgi:DNA-directed RNA polymerase alpha subunit